MGDIEKQLQWKDVKVELPEDIENFEMKYFLVKDDKNKCFITLRIKTDNDKFIWGKLNQIITHWWDIGVLR